MCVALVGPSVPPPLQRSPCIRSTSQTNKLLSRFEDIYRGAFCSAVQLPAFQEVEDMFFPLDQGCRLMCFLNTLSNSTVYPLPPVINCTSVLLLEAHFCLFHVGPPSTTLLLSSVLLNPCGSCSCLRAPSCRTKDSMCSKRE